MSVGAPILRAAMDLYVATQHPTTAAQQPRIAKIRSGDVISRAAEQQPQPISLRGALHGEHRRARPVPLQHSRRGQRL